MAAQFQTRMDWKVSETAGIRATMSARVCMLLVGMLVLTIASPASSAAETWIGFPLQKAPCPAAAEKSSSRKGS